MWKIDVELSDRHSKSRDSRIFNCALIKDFKNAKRHVNRNPESKKDFMFVVTTSNYLSKKTCCKYCRNTNHPASTTIRGGLVRKVVRIFFH